jgi:hypothetical protein
VATLPQAVRDNARTYPTPEGVRLNVNAIAVAYDVHPTTFLKHQRNGWARLFGGKLEARTMLYARAGDRSANRREDTFLDRDVEAVLGQAPLTGGRYVLPDGSVRLNSRAVMRELGLLPLALSKLVAAGKLAPREGRSPETGKSENTFAEADVLAYKRQRDADRQARARPTCTDPSGRVFVRQRAAARALGVNRTTLWKWRRGGCHLLGGLALTTWEHGAETWYLQAEIEEIKRRAAAAATGRAVGRTPGRLSAAEATERYGFDRATLKRWESYCPHLPSGQLVPRLERDRRGQEVATYAESDLQEVRRGRALPPPEVLPAGDGGREMTLARAAREHGIRAQRLLKYTLACRYLPEGRLPSRRVRRRGFKGRWPVVVREADVLRLKAAIRAELDRGASLPADWKEAKDIAAGLGESAGPNHAALYALLKHWREAAELPADQVARLRAGRPHWVWVYDAARFEELLAGRRLEEVVRSMGGKVYMTQESPGVDAAGGDGPRARTPGRPVPQRSAESVGGAEPLPLAAHPVRIAGVDPAVLAALRAALVGGGPQAPAAGAVILALGKGQYRVGDSDPVTVTEAEDVVLRSFVGRPSMGHKALVRAAGSDEAPRTLRQLAEKYDGVFAAAIRCPGRRGAGGYRVAVRATPA